MSQIYSIFLLRRVKIVGLRIQLQSARIRIYPHSRPFELDPVFAPRLEANHLFYQPSSVPFCATDY